MHAGLTHGTRSGHSRRARRARRRLSAIPHFLQPAEAMQLLTRYGGSFAFLFYQQQDVSLLAMTCNFMSRISKHGALLLSWYRYKLRFCSCPINSNQLGCHFCCQLFHIDQVQIVTHRAFYPNSTKQVCLQCLLCFLSVLPAY